MTPTDRVKLRELLAKARPGPVYATADQHRGEPNWDAWTVGPSSDHENWATDGGTDGYGLPRADAELLAFLWNHAEELAKEPEQ